VTKQLFTLEINRETYEVYTAVHKTLLEVLREDLGLTGTKHGCELGECGLCTVLIEGQAKLSCLTLPVAVEGCAITTIEGLAHNGALHPLQAAFAEYGASQCGYCTPGMVLAATAMIDTQPQLTRREIREKLAGNLCRCTGYTKILEAIEAYMSTTPKVNHS
jgi:aerobic-type carbon monoxide dehydrogenase small subunit (CoxS/CutS family)